MFWRETAPIQKTKPGFTEKLGVDSFVQNFFAFKVEASECPWMLLAFDQRWAEAVTL